MGLLGRLKVLVANFYLLVLETFVNNIYGLDIVIKLLEIFFMAL